MFFTAKINRREGNLNKNGRYCFSVKEKSGFAMYSEVGQFQIIQETTKKSKNLLKWTEHLNRRQD